MTFRIQSQSNKIRHSPDPVHNPSPVQCSSLLIRHTTTVTVLPLCCYGKVLDFTKKTLDSQKKH